MLVVGLTGDVGAGKSTAARIWKEKGALIIDADQVAKELWEDPDVLARATERWGPSIVDDRGHLIPAHVAAIVFERPDEYRWLCDLLHPRVRREMERRVESSTGWIVAEIPLLFENGVPWWIDMTAYVTAPITARMARNTDRNWTEVEIRRRESWFLPTAEKTARSDLIIENANGLEELHERLIGEATTMETMAAVTAFRARTATPEGAHRFVDTLRDRKLVTETVLSDCLAEGYTLNDRHPEIRRTAKEQQERTSARLEPLRHMDLPTLRRLAGNLKP